LAADPKFLALALKLATENVEKNGGGPFGAVLARDGKVIATGVNRVTATNDPTAHAEVVAIRCACEALGSFQLEGCELYTSCEPCPMCLGAIYWARPSAYYYANTQEDAAAAGFDDSFIYREFPLPPEERQIPGYYVKLPAAHVCFDAWRKSHTRKEY
jgi:tRNA(Arg) A34 adenosine deaminase TadA